ncbi:winged helix-turn-helix transcriptional regulator [Zoogloea sp.]|mgnify:CR=1 FL=1|uniref:winged helix-turn-helix transcriptional regulator n=1 Tax=Zoogloea sp. TaxID=49181 RepID=UPI0035B0D153
MRPLDPIDRKILEALQHDGRVTMTDLANLVGLSATPCTERVRRMEREGIIAGYHARVNPHALERPVLVFLQIRLAGKSPEILESARRALGTMDGIVEAHLVAGDFDYLVKARLAATGDYPTLLGALHAALPPIAECRSQVVMAEIKETLYLQP